MKRSSVLWIVAFSAGLGASIAAQAAQKVVDIPTRPGVTQRLVYLAPERPKAAVVLFAGGHGGLQIDSAGGFRWGAGNFLVRSRKLFAEQGLAVAVVDAPSDRQQEPFLYGFRQTPQHVMDIKAVTAWLRQQTRLPIWLVGTSRGTQSAAFIATQARPADGGPDGLVLTSTVLKDPRGRAVPEMPLQALTIPVLVVHHEQDGCSSCAYRDILRLMDKLGAAPRRELITFRGGMSVGDPCEAKSHHGYNGLEPEVVARIVQWILVK